MPKGTTAAKQLAGLLLLRGLTDEYQRHMTSIVERVRSGKLQGVPLWSEFSATYKRGLEELPGWLTPEQHRVIEGFFERDKLQRLREIRRVGQKR